MTPMPHVLPENTPVRVSSTGVGGGMIQFVPEQSYSTEPRGSRTDIDVAAAQVRSRKREARSIRHWQTHGTMIFMHSCAIHYIVGDVASCHRCPFALGKRTAWIHKLEQRCGCRFLCRSQEPPPITKRLILAVILTVIVAVGDNFLFTIRSGLRRWVADSFQAEGVDIVERVISDVGIQVHTAVIADGVSLQGLSVLTRLVRRRSDFS